LGSPDQVTGSEVQAVEVLPKFAVALLQVQPVNQLVLPLQATPILLGLGEKKLDSVAASNAVTPSSFEPLMNKLVSVGVKPSLLPLPANAD
jgi:hypothetical protein